MSNRRRIHVVVAAALATWHGICFAASTPARAASREEVGALADAFDCKFKDGSTSYDLSKLTQTPLNVNESVSTPPTTTITSTWVSLCSALDPSLFKDDPAAERCPDGSRVCTRIYSEMEGSDRRILNVIPIAADDRGGKIVKASGRDDAWVLTLYGPSYSNVDQSLELSLVCAASGTAEKPPQKLDYDFATGVLKGEWTTAMACAVGDKPDDSRREEPGKGEAGRDGPYDPAGRAARGWIGSFFTFLFIGLIAYFAIGIYHNHSEYGIWDIPHKDFWRELPLTIRDLLFRRRPARGGYSALS